MKMKVKSREKAWNKADIIFPTDYAKDEARSSRAGYPVYYSTANGVAAWISDLGDRLEINLENGETVNIWIDEKPEFSESQLADALSVIDNAIYDIDDKVNNNLSAKTGIKAARNALYEAYKEIVKILETQHPASPLFALYNLQDAD